MKYLKQMLCVSICGVMLVAATGCSGSLTGGKRIIRISHAQSETHPEHLGLLKFKEYVEANLGNKYEVQIFPNELLGSAQKAIELTQTGAIDCRCVRDFQHALPVHLRRSLPCRHE